MLLGRQFFNATFVAEALGYAGQFWSAELEILTAKVGEIIFQLRHLPAEEHTSGRTGSKLLQARVESSSTCVVVIAFSFQEYSCRPYCYLTHAKRSPFSKTVVRYEQVYAKLQKGL